MRNIKKYIENAERKSKTHPSIDMTIDEANYFSNVYSEKGIYDVIIEAFMFGAEIGYTAAERKYKKENRSHRQYAAPVFK